MKLTNTKNIADKGNASRLNCSKSCIYPFFFFFSFFHSEIILLDHSIFHPYFSKFWRTFQRRLPFFYLCQGLLLLWVYSFLDKTYRQNNQANKQKKPKVFNSKTFYFPEKLIVKLMGLYRQTATVHIYCIQTTLLLKLNCPTFFPFQKAHKSLDLYKSVYSQARWKI